MYLIQRHTTDRTETIAKIEDKERALEELEWYFNHEYRENTAGFSVSLNGNIIAELEM